MTTVKLTVGPDQTPEEEAALVARVAAAVAEQTGSETINFELIHSEELNMRGEVAERMQASSRWSA
ncbi:MAG: hypothetical protein ACR2MA_06715 [Egibacteraceae bacterium]